MHWWNFRERIRSPRKVPSESFKLELVNMVPLFSTWIYTMLALPWWELILFYTMKIQSYDSVAAI